MAVLRVLLVFGGIGHRQPLKSSLLACAATDGLLLYYEEVDLLQQGAARDDGRVISSQPKDLANSFGP
jgi:hypothetical protein